jgi:hypothetical protein
MRITASRKPTETRRACFGERLRKLTGHRISDVSSDRIAMHLDSALGKVFAGEAAGRGSFVR